MYSELLNSIKSYQPEIIYLSVGCSMERYENITPENNQQNPLFMQKYINKKCYILIDPSLETPLRLESQIALNEVSNKENYRVLTNTNYLVFGINKHFYYGHDDKDNNYIFLLSLIEYTLEYNTKFILQDYTGRDISNVYISLFNIFPKEILLKKVIFDISQQNGSCLINFKDNPIYYDTQNNFIQHRFLPLVQITKNNIYFKHIILYRMNLISYELSRFSTENIDNILNTLSIIYDFENIDNIKNVILLLMHDIINSLEIETTQKIQTIQTIQNSNYNQSVIINCISKLKNILN